jgi:hypothetical protein
MQALMGKLAARSGKLTDAVACYRVTGQIGAPQVEMEFAAARSPRRRGVGDGVRSVVGGSRRSGIGSRGR